MAQKKSTTRASKNARATAKAPQKKPRRREIGALVFLFLAVFAFIGYFEKDAIFIKWFTVAMRAMFGWGAYLVPPVLLACAAILGFHRGKPVTFRLVCTLLVPFAVGGLYQLIAGGKVQELTWQIFPTLTTAGVAAKSGGFTGGIVAVLFERWFSKAGAITVFIVGLVFLLMSAMSLTPSGIAEKIRAIHSTPYEPEPESEASVQRQLKKTIKAPAVPAEPVPEDETDPHAASRRKIRAYDIPFGEEPTPKVESPEIGPALQKKSFFKTTPGVKTPDQLLRGEEGETKAPVNEPIPAARAENPEPEQTSAARSAAARKGQDTVSLQHAVESGHPEPVRIVSSSETRSEAGRVEKTQEPSGEPFRAPTQEELTAAPDDYVFPPVSLLNTEEATRRPDGRAEMSINKDRLEATLRSFGVNSSISNIIRGPSVTRYELELEPGVKLSKITTLSDDIALALGASGVRVAAIPNKVATVGIEVPNQIVSTVYLRDIIESPEIQNASSKLTFAIGKNIAGESIVGDIAKLPHLLVAGTTGSGKSICLNSLILSILYKARPDEVKFILVDPKMVEFKPYNGIPHLLVPVVTEAKKASGALQWAVYEMMKRYRMFSDSGARDLAGYNEFALESGEEEPLPQIVVVIDELADLMLVAAKEVEESICRVAQMGRAAGVHLVIATQSPRADVITGLMKANIPSRIAFKVSSALESRIILDAGGAADKLVGKGDMLYAPIGTSKPARIQGTWVSDKEREDILNFLKQSGDAEYSDEVIRQIDRAAEDKGTGKNVPAQGDSEEPFSDYDEMLPQAVDVILECGQASVSLLQRRLKLGYSRAARIVDQMEEIGVVGPFEGSKPRQILVTKQQWQERQFIQGTAPTERYPEDDMPLDMDNME